MKSTIKFLLIISLFCSSAIFTYADGDQEQGGRCETCSTFGPEQEFAVAPETPTTMTASEAPQAANSTKDKEVTFDDELLQFLRIWFNSLLG